MGCKQSDCTSNLYIESFQHLLCDKDKEAQGILTLSCLVCVSVTFTSGSGKKTYTYTIITMTQLRLSAPLKNRLVIHLSYSID